MTTSVGSNAYLTLIGTIPDNEGSGYAERLICEAEKMCKNSHMKYFKLETDFLNTRAIAFYSKLGFKIDFTDEKVHMVKELY